MTLLNISKGAVRNDQQKIAAGVALCRVFCQLMASGSMTVTKESSEKDLVVIKWLLDRLHECHTSFLGWLKLNDAQCPATALTLLMRLIREEGKHLHQAGFDLTSKGVLPQLITVLVNESPSGPLYEEFAGKYLAEFDDIRYNALGCIA